MTYYNYAFSLPSCLSLTVIMLDTNQSACERWLNCETQANKVRLIFHQILPVISHVVLILKGHKALF